MAGKAHQHGPLSPSRYVAGGRGVAAHACLCCWGWRSGMASGRWCLRQWGSGSPSRWQWRSGSGCCFWLPMHWQRRRASKQGPGCLMGPSTMANIPCPMLLVAFSMGRIRLHPSIRFFFRAKALKYQAGLQLRLSPLFVISSLDSTSGTCLSYLGRLCGRKKLKYQIAQTAFAVTGIYSLPHKMPLVHIKPLYLCRRRPLSHILTCTPTIICHGLL